MNNPDIREAYNNKLKSKLFGLLCEYEKGREWEKFLDSILIELMGYDESENFSHSLPFSYSHNSPNSLLFSLLL